MRVCVRRRQGDCLIDVSFQGDPEGITALYGPSGVGKTSVINMVAGLIRPDAGRIALKENCLFDASRGIDLPPEKRRAGYVFQEGRLFPHLSVKANLLYGQYGKKKNTGVEFAEVVELLGIGKLLNRNPGTLSGGEKQRVAFGRAVLSFPRLLLMDEPLASLDAVRKRELLPYIQLLNRRYHIPVLYVSHSLEEIRMLAATVIPLGSADK